MMNRRTTELLSLCLAARDLAQNHFRDTRYEEPLLQLADSITSWLSLALKQREIALNAQQQGMVRKLETLVQKLEKQHEAHEATPVHRRIQIP